MSHPRKSNSSLSLSEFMSATEIDTTTNFPGPNQLQRRASRDFLPSPLVGSHYELPNRNTIVHSTQSSPSLTTEIVTPDTLSIIELRKSLRKTRSKNPALDQISLDFSQESLMHNCSTGGSNRESGTDDDSIQLLKTKNQTLTRQKKQKDDAKTNNNDYLDSRCPIAT